LRVDSCAQESWHPLQGIGALLLRVRTELLEHLNCRLATSGPLAGLELTAAQLFVLAMLATSTGPMTVTELCRGLSYDAGAMTRMLDRLESKGLIVRRRDTCDRRVVWLRMTEQGKACYPPMRENALVVHNQLLHGFTPAEVQQLEALMTRMLENVLQSQVRRR
jgi:MarR family transcriptional regulator, multiple antibiotic resistance protein MarR